MRLWSIHPRYLDAKGLVALWREGLLAQKVLSGKTRGYKNHPQLERFKSHPDPKAAISAYLHEVCDEADRRGYRFERARIECSRRDVSAMAVTDGQIEYEYGHLKSKLEHRAPDVFCDLERVTKPENHPSFDVVSGPMASWERPLDSL